MASQRASVDKQNRVVIFLENRFGVKPPRSAHRTACRFFPILSLGASEGAGAEERSPFSHRDLACAAEVAAEGFQKSLEGTPGLGNSCWQGVVDG